MRKALLHSILFLFFVIPCLGMEGNNESKHSIPQLSHESDTEAWLRFAQIGGCYDGQLHWKDSKEIQNYLIKDEKKLFSASPHGIFGAFNKEKK